MADSLADPGNPSVAFSDSSPFRRACNNASMPPLKGEVPAARAVGLYSKTLAASIYGGPGSRSIRRQQVAVGTAD